MADDPSRHIPKPPKQVSDQVAAVEAMINGNAQPPNGSPPAEAAQTAELTTTPAPTNPAQVSQPVPELTPPPAQQPQPGAGTQPPVHQPGVEDDDSWERKFKSLQGRHETIAKNYQQQTERLNNLETLLATLQASGHRTDSAPPAELQPEKLLTPAEIEEYGEDFLGVIGKRSKEAVSPELLAINLKLSELENQVKGAATVIQKTQKQRFYDDLTGAVPEWRAINKSPEFGQWVDSVDPYSGQPRRQMLLDAFTRQDTRRVINFFSGFLTEATGTPPNGSSPGNGAPPLAQPGNGSGRPSLEQFAAPGRARSAPAGNLPPDKPIYTSASIAKFMGDRLKGLWKGREAEAAAVEADIFLAQREGRIQV